MIEHTATLTTDTSDRSTAYDSMIFGGFLEHFHRKSMAGCLSRVRHWPTKGFRNDVVAALKELKYPSSAGPADVCQRLSLGGRCRGESYTNG